MNNGNAVLLVKREILSDGATSPTIRKEYRCPCGCGRIVEESVPGFCEFTVWINCGACKERYNLLTGRGHIWELTEK